MDRKAAAVGAVLSFVNCVGVGMAVWGVFGLVAVSILMNLARDLSDYFQFFGRKLHIVIFLALSKAFSAGLKAFP
mgnify:CR=1 FL=1